jgi:hypothetical protein
MLSCEPILYERLPIFIRVGSAWLSPDEVSVLEEIRSGVPRGRRARARSLRSSRFLPIQDILGQWLRGRAVFNVSDLHYIGTRFDRHVITSALNDFSFLSRGPYVHESQDSLVISAAGAFTDSHSDDHAGTNHCFVGEKLWLMWDTVEGLDCGLEDVERCEVFDRARFEMETFLTLNSSRWLVIGPGQTMFIPTNMTHKVITLKKYLGLGTFYAGFPGFIDALLHWAKLSPYWSNLSSSYQEYRVEYLVRRALRRLRELHGASHAVRARWGIPFLKKRIERFRRSGESRLSFGQDKNVQTFVCLASPLT